MEETIKVLREYDESGYHVVEYTLDGETISHTVKSVIGVPDDAPPKKKVDLQTLSDENEALKTQIAELNQAQSDFMDYVFSAIPDLPQ